jgi:hypothetical protein
MSQAAELTSPVPLTVLPEEKLFQASVRRFAKERLAQHVRSMNEQAAKSSGCTRKIWDYRR